MFRITCFLILTIIGSFLFAQDVEIEGNLSVDDSVSIGSSSALDQFYLYKLEGDPSLTLHKQTSLFGGVSNNYGRIWQNQSLNLAYDQSATGSQINLHDNFMRLQGKILLSPFDACDANGIQELRLVADRGVRVTCLDTGSIDLCNVDCSQDVINFYPEHPFEGDFQSNLGTIMRPWDLLHVKDVRTSNISVDAMAGGGVRNVVVTNSGILTTGEPVVTQGVFTAQPYDFSSAFYEPFHLMTGNRFIGGNIPNNINSYVAPVHVPNGSTIDSVKFTYQDESIKESLFMLLAVSPTRIGGAESTYSFSSGVATTCGSQCSETIVINEAVDNESDNFYIFVRPTDLTWDTDSEEVAFGSAIVYYHK